MTKKLELDIEYCYDCPYSALLDDNACIEYCCKYENGPDHINIDDAFDSVHKDCPLKDKEN